MRAVITRLRTRVAPALLTAAGISLTAAGLLTYSMPAAADSGGSNQPSFATGAPTASYGLITFPPLDTSQRSTPTPGPRVSTRVVIPALRIDLPVVKPPSGFPYCNVAMYLSIFSQPGLPGATYIFAHARTGMFLPLLTRSMVNNGKSMLGLKVEVYTSDDQVYLYNIVQVRRHYPASGTLQDLPLKDGQLWLQTSEGPYSSSAKLQVVADYVSNTLADHADAHPKPHPVVCG